VLGTNGKTILGRELRYGKGTDQGQNGTFGTGQGVLGATPGKIYQNQIEPRPPHFNITINVVEPTVHRP
jgi:hypothetical protein